MIQDQDSQDSTFPKASRFDRLVRRVGNIVERIANPPPTVVTIRLSGMIGDVSRFKQGLMLDQLNDTLEKAFSYPHAVAVALLINSPGGSPTQSRLIATRIRELAEEKSLPVISFVEDVAASGGYWLACAGDDIYATETSIVGSIGVISSGFGFQEAIKKLGIERRIYTQGKHKSILDPFEPEKASDIKLLTAIQKDLHDTFTRFITECRGTRLKGKKEALFTGEFWTGNQALTLGLIDDIGTLHAVVKERFGDKVRFKAIGKRKSNFERLLGVSKDSQKPEAIVEAALDALESRLIWQQYQP